MHQVEATGIEEEEEEEGEKGEEGEEDVKESISRDASRPCSKELLGL
jgi:hypothetical protein